MTPTKSKLVLLAEDDAVNRDIVRTILSAEPAVELVEATDGRAALEAALERRYDLLVVDQNMPFVPGDRVVRFLRASITPNSRTPVIHFTAHASAAGAISAGAGPVDVVLPKPIRAAEFLDCVKRLLGL